MNKYVVTYIDGYSLKEIVISCHDISKVTDTIEYDYYNIESPSIISIKLMPE
jgi:hypothetical protein